MLFIHQSDRIFAGAFSQNVVQRLHPGAEAAIAFDAIPLPGLCRQGSGLIGAVSQGQLQASRPFSFRRNAARRPI
jgi:hypothetical protein